MILFILRPKLVFVSKKQVSKPTSSLFSHSNVYSSVNSFPSYGFQKQKSYCNMNF